jgi:hypothetical protein
MAEFKSVFKDEMGKFIDLCSAQGKSIGSIKSGILNLDTYLHKTGCSSKVLPVELVRGWIG